MSTAMLRSTGAVANVGTENSKRNTFFFSRDQAALKTPLSVRPSVCYTVSTMFLTLYYHELLPLTKVMSIQKVKVKGQDHRGQNKFCSNLGVSGL